MKKQKQYRFSRTISLNVGLLTDLHKITEMLVDFTLAFSVSGYSIISGTDGILQLLFS